MELGFNVKNVGPLANIGLQIITLDQVVQIAIGAYGWYKGRERSQSLATLLATKGATLVSTSTFDKRSYHHYRTDHDNMLGVVVQKGCSKSIPLPEASTGFTDDPGQACLRALTTGLLCST